MAVFAAAAILVHLVRRFALRASLGIYKTPLLAALVFGSIPSLLLFFSMNTSPVPSLF